MKKSFIQTIIFCMTLSVFTSAHAQLAQQELDPQKAEAIAKARLTSLIEPTPEQIEKDLRSQGVIDTQTQDVMVSDLNFPIGLFPVGPTDFIVVKVHRDSRPQYAEIFYNGQYMHSYWVSTGAPGHETPTVSRTVYERNWNRTSRAYGGTMTGAMMYNGGFGVHMTPFLSKLGTPASHGCVRMEDAGIYTLWKLAMGTPNANITVQILDGEREGIPPKGLAPYKGGKLQPVEDISGRPRGGRSGALKVDI
jgi:hypothetical protein